MLHLLHHSGLHRGGGTAQRTGGMRTLGGLCSLLMYSFTVQYGGAGDCICMMDCMVCQSIDWRGGMGEFLLNPRTRKCMM